MEFQEIVRNSRKFFLESFHVPSIGMDKYISQGMKSITDRAKIYIYILVESNVSFDVDLLLCRNKVIRARDARCIKNRARILTEMYRKSVFA